MKDLLLLSLCVLLLSCSMWAVADTPDTECYTDSCLQCVDCLDTIDRADDSTWYEAELSKPWTSETDRLAWEASEAWNAEQDQREWDAWDNENKR